MRKRYAYLSLLTPIIEADFDAPLSLIQVTNVNIDTCNSFVNWCRGVAAIESAVMEAAGEKFGKDFTHLSIVLPETPSCGANGMAWLGGSECALWNVYRVQGWVSFDRI